MRAFFVQIKCELGRSYDVATAIADAGKIHTIPGIRDTKTIITFRAF